MLTIVLKTVVNINYNTLTKSIAGTNTNTAFEEYCQYQYFCENTFYCFYIQHRSFFRGHLLIKLIKWLLSRNGIYSGLMLSS